MWGILLILNINRTCNTLNGSTTIGLLRIYNGDLRVIMDHLVMNKLESNDLDYPLTDRVMTKVFGVSMSSL